MTGFYSTHSHTPLLLASTMAKKESKKTDTRSGISSPPIKEKKKINLKQQSCIRCVKKLKLGGTYLETSDGKYVCHRCIDELGVNRTSKSKCCIL